MLTPLDREESPFKCDIIGAKNLFLKVTEVSTIVFFAENSLSSG
jgi:hypothetical protein